jgi:hypothetical protein
LFVATRPLSDDACSDLEQAMTKQIAVAERSTVAFIVVSSMLADPRFLRHLACQEYCPVV